MATKVKTDAETDMPWTIPLILQTMLPNGQPVEKSEITYLEMILANYTGIYTLIEQKYCKWCPIMYALLNLHSVYNDAVHYVECHLTCIYLGHIESPKQLGY